MEKKVLLARMQLSLSPQEESVLFAKGYLAAVVVLKVRHLVRINKSTFRRQPQQ